MKRADRRKREEDKRTKGMGGGVWVGRKWENGHGKDGRRRWGGLEQETRREGREEREERIGATVWQRLDRRQDVAPHCFPP